MLNDWILNLGIVGIAIVIFIESGFPFGFFLPGDTLLFAAGILAAKGNFTVEAAIIIIFFANFFGVTVGYWSGIKLIDKLDRIKDNFFFKKEYIERATVFYEKHGGKAIILGRFIPAVRSFVPIVAGIANMHYRKLIYYNAIGAGIWVIGVTLIGFFAGTWLENHGINIELLLLPIFIIVIVLTFLAPLIHSLRKKDTRHKILRKIGLKPKK